MMSDQKESAAEQGMYGANQYATIISPSVGPHNVNVLGAILRVMQRVGFVHKGGENEFHGYKYATEADTIAALRPALIAEGLIILPTISGAPRMDDHGNTHVMMAYRIFHAQSGEGITVNIPGSGNDRSSKGSVGDKGIYKAMTGAMKYMLRQTFMLETGDDPERGNAVDAGLPEDDKMKTQQLLKVATTLVELASKCDSPDVLQQVWKDNIGSVELLKKEHHELFERVRDAFSARKKALSPEVTQPQP